METIDDIVKEMLKEVRESEINNPDKTTRIFLTSANMALKDFAARLKKANKSLEAEKSRIIAELNEVRELNRKCCDENESLKAELDRINLAVRHNLHAHRHEGTADLAREMVAEKGPVTREMVAGWAARVVDLGVYGSKQVSKLKKRIEQQRIVARSYCKYIARLEAALKHVLECKTLNMDQQEHDDMPSYTVIVKCHNAVRAAQRTFNGKKKERINEDK